MHPTSLGVTWSARGLASLAAHPAPPLTLAGDTRSVRQGRPIECQFRKGSRGLRLSIALLLVLVMAGVGGARDRTSICDVQEYDDMGFSPLQGQSVTVTGIVTCPPGYFQPYYTSFFIESGGCGVNVFAFEYLAASLALGDSVEVSGEVMEYVSSSTGAGATTEILTSETGVVVLSTGNPAPIPTQVTCSELNQEENEGRLLSIMGVVTDLELPYLFYISDGTDEVEVYRGSADSVSFAGIHSGDTLCVTGLVAQYDRTPPFLDGYELMPRTDRDFEECSSTPVKKGSWGTIKAAFR